MEKPIARLRSGIMGPKADHTLIKHRRLLFLFLLIALLVGAMASDPVHSAVSHALDSAKQFIRHHEVLGLTLFVFLSALSAMFFFFSTAVIVPVAVYAWGKP